MAPIYLLYHIPTINAKVSLDTLRVLGYSVNTQTNKGNKMCKQKATDKAIAATLKRHGTLVGCQAEACYKRFYLFYLTM